MDGVLKSRAALEGKPLSGYLVGRTAQDCDGWRANPPVQPAPPPAQAMREERDRR
jgi:hypothetical protein